MANGMGSLYIGASGLQSSQNALNTTANNLANVDTKGYVRQQVLFSDRNYTTFNKTSAISYQQSGLGVSIGDVVHSRDIFLDKYYRNEAGRQAFYETVYEAVNEVEDLFQELEGDTFQDLLNDFWVSFQELAKAPDASVQQNLVIQKATLFTERVQSMYSNLVSYQKNLNVQITDSVDRVNELGETIQSLNLQIQKIEAGGIETAMSLRDERDNALDELSTLVNIQYKENHEGVVKVSVEGVNFVDGVNVYKMGLQQDHATDFLTPYWPHLSNVSGGEYYKVFDTANEISTAYNTDVGKLKALVIARGDHFATYSDIEGVSASVYNSGIAKSVAMNSQAELDQLVHTMVTALNDLLCPNTTASFTGVDGTVYNNVKVWDEANAAVGSDKVKPGHELFVRNGCERYTKVEATDGTTYYVYNEEDPNDTSKQYTIESINVNPLLVGEESLIPYLTSNWQPDQELANKLRDIWEKDLLKLNPNETDSCTFSEYYQRMIDELATQGSVYGSLATTLSGSVTSINNSRQSVIGVSSDEELTNMIKYQSAYNAASRYINVISEMLEHLITQLGS